MKLHATHNWGRAKGHRRFAAVVASTVAMTGVTAAIAIAPPAHATVPSVSSAQAATGYWVALPGGAVEDEAGAPDLGSMVGRRLNAPIDGIASTRSGAGYWLLGKDGGIFSFGDARFWGSTGALRLAAPVVAMAATSDDRGYWLLARDGGIFSFGDAQFHGSTGGVHLHSPIVAMTPTPDGRGYWLLASDGGIFTFGSAPFFGSTGAAALSSPVVGMASTADGAGYWLVDAAGGVYSFGDASALGSATAMVASHGAAVGILPSGNGYRIVMADGTSTTYASTVAASGDGQTSGAPPVSTVASPQAPATLPPTTTSAPTTPTGPAGTLPPSTGPAGTLPPSTVPSSTLPPSTGPSSTLPSPVPTPSTTVPAPTEPPFPPAGPPTGGVASIANTIQQVIDDMSQPHEASPDGVPSFWSWANAPELDAGSIAPAGYSALTMWGQAYLASGTSPVDNVRLELTNARSFVWSISQARWVLLQSTSTVDGAHYVDDFSGNASIPSDARTEADGGTSVSMAKGFNFHFWPSDGRATIDPSDVGGVFTEVQARLVPDDPAGPDNLAQAHYIVNVGGDYWQSTVAPYPDNHQIFEGRFRYATPTWQWYNASSWTPAQLSQNPPPLNS